MGEAGLGIDGREGEGRGGDAVEGGGDGLVEVGRCGLAVWVRGERGWSWVGGGGAGLEDREEKEEIEWRNGRDHFLGLIYLVFLFSHGFGWRIGWWMKRSG